MEVEPCCVNTPLRVTNGEEENLTINKYLTRGGFSRIFLGSLGKQQVAVKVIEIQKHPLRNLILKKMSFLVKKEHGKPRLVKLRDVTKEVRWLRNLQENEYILKFFGEVYFKDEAWIVTEFCGKDFEHVYKMCYSKYGLGADRRGSLFVHFFAPILKALIYMHDKNLIHRDVKLENIMISSNGVPKLVDFGLCVEMSEVTHTYKPKLVAGTDYHMPMEGVLKQPLTEKFDAFSFAITMGVLHSRKSLFVCFDRHRWEEVTYVYLCDPENRPELEDELRKTIMGLQKGQTKFCKIGKDVMKSMADCLYFDQHKRKSLRELATNEHFQKAFDEWENYHFTHDNLSENFKLFQGMAAGAFEYDNAPLTTEFLEFRQYSKEAIEFNEKYPRKQNSGIGL